jgi:hypothetical protein
MKEKNNQKQENSFPTKSKKIETKKKKIAKTNAHFRIKKKNNLLFILFHFKRLESLFF